MRLPLLVATVALGGAAALAQSVPSWADPTEPTAQSVPGPLSNSTAPPPTPFAPAAVPVDGGLGLLALAGAALAARKLRQRSDAEPPSP